MTVTWFNVLDFSAKQKNRDLGGGLIYQGKFIWLNVVCATALWEHKGGQEDIRKISGKMHKKQPRKKCIRFTYRFYLGLIFVSLHNQNLILFTKIKFECIFIVITRD